MQQNDFYQMQNQAIRYAQEMQKRASPQKTPDPPKNEQFNQHHRERETPFCNNACPVKSILGTGGNQQGDSDILLLMALLLVLTADGGDRMLMMALLYIMT